MICFSESSKKFKFSQNVSKNRTYKKSQRKNLMKIALYSLTRYLLLKQNKIVYMYIDKDIIKSTPVVLSVGCSLQKYLVWAVRVHSYPFEGIRVIYAPMKLPFGAPELS